LKLKKLEKYKQSYVDIFLQAELRAIVNNGEMEMTKKAARNLKLTFATYVKQDWMVISEEFWNKHIERKPVKRDGIKKLPQNIDRSPKDDERDLILENPIIVCLTFTHVILLTEQWENWKLMDDAKLLHSYMKELNK
jgi:hypothetical protein